jgi:hypothetical protein
MEIYANATHTTNPGSTSPFIPHEEWIQLTQEQRDAILDKRRKTTGNPPGGRVPSSQLVQGVNAHLLEDHVNLDDIIEYTVNTHLLHEVSNEFDTTKQPDMLLPHKSGQSPSPNGTLPGDIRHVIAGKQSHVHKKGNSVKVNKGSTNPDTLTVGDRTYFLNKGETITFQGHQYFTYSTFVQYCIGQNEFTATDMALIDRGANGCACGDDMRVFEGSERYVDVSGLGGHLRIVTAQALIENHKGVEQSGLPSKKYVDQIIGLINTIDTYSTTAVSLLQLRSKEPRTTGTIRTSRCYQTSYLEL